ncbi:MAG: metal-binding protein [Alphaproteobacteria bacterium]|nr:MAG: metal-binding protein [Alphaproteobacteria bacterium]
MKRALFRRDLLKGASASVAAAALVGLSGCARDARAYGMHVSRDAGCGCCHAWTQLMGRSGRFRTELENVADMRALKQRLGVPEDLGSCHTAVVEGFVIEGHVPAEEIVRLIETRPEGVRGLAVPGMPLGSPGMETPDGAQEPYEIIAFASDGARFVFARRPSA